MKHTHIAAAFLVPLLAACAAGPEPAPPTPASPPLEAEAPSDNLSNAEIEAIYRQRIEDSWTRFVEADVRFMTHMIHHHAQAIEISRFAPDRAASDQIRTLAARIINAQRDEIALMQRWLEDRDQPVPELHEMGGRIMVHAPDMDHGSGMSDMSGMPGMLSPEQVDRLEASDGQTFDRLFLTYMIEHHQGAVTMVRELFSTDGAGQDEDVFRFASDVQVDQSTEVARMELMLDAMPR
ncbi:MAG: DUF305 domain-containing protein [Gemmatimonadota bacterium]